MTMGLDQKGSSVFHVNQRHDGKWQVIEEGFIKPLAFFVQGRRCKKVCKWDCDTRVDSRVKIDDWEFKNNTNWVF